MRSPVHAFFFARTFPADPVPNNRCGSHAKNWAKKIPSPETGNGTLTE
jgi:hypothetical protein